LSENQKSSFKCYKENETEEKNMSHKLKKTTTKNQKQNGK
jgi:hypothetical protein